MFLKKKHLYLMACRDFRGPRSAEMEEVPALSSLGFICPAGKCLESLAKTKDPTDLT